ncbi:histone-like nucleoid-structuring protein Lsr2 [Streptomyces sp. NPDC013457]|uniref:WhiB family transcriptional regulator n=1 Tax=Streptomyces sp. NPDC013457 TaxID=3364866 RepID=UPI0036FC118E
MTSLELLSPAAPYLANWQERAACAGADTNLWFGQPHQIRSAIAACSRCPVRAECLHDALAYETPGAARYGIRGGLNGNERNQLPDLPSSATEAVAALRELLNERTPEPMTTTPALHPAPTAADAPVKAGADVRLRAVPADTTPLPVGKLLTWGDQHTDPAVQDQAARARAALSGLRKRHAADQELTALTTEREQLEQRLAELAARESELAPSKAKRKRTAYVRNYDTRTVRAWADANGIECARIGQIPKRVLEAWRAANPAS